MKTRLALSLAAPAFRWGILILAGAMWFVRPAAAQIVIRTKRAPSATWSPLAPLTIGGGLEFETDSERSEYGFPFFLEYSFSERLKVLVEPNFGAIKSKSRDVRSVQGFGDLETSLEYEFLRERRYRPALTAEALVKWPTANHPDIGNPGRDYSLGLVMSKDLVSFDLDMNLLYTFVGDPAATDTLEISLAAERPLTHSLALEAEVVTTVGSGGIRGQPGTIGGLGGSRAGENLTEGTIALAEQIKSHLKLEQGFIYRSDGTWQLVFAWEWNFGGRD